MAGLLVETTSSSACSYPAAWAAARSSSIITVPIPMPQKAWYKAMATAHRWRVLLLEDTALTEQLPASSPSTKASNSSSPPASLFCRMNSRSFSGVTVISSGSRIK